jgi:hypothetical protein
MHRLAEHHRGAVRTKPDPQHFCGSTWPQQQRAINLSGQETARLALPLPQLKSFKRLAPVQDQLCLAVRHHALWRGILAAMFQNPKGIYEPTQFRRWTDFSIPDHTGIIASDAELAQMMIHPVFHLKEFSP